MEAHAFIRYGRLYHDWGHLSMAIPLYLAKTAAEFARTEAQPEHLAWMACHFSPYGTDLTNLPAQLPPGSLLILNDRTPVHGHDPKRIRTTLENLIGELSCRGLLLDLQRCGSAQTQRIVDELLCLPCPVCVSEPYAGDQNCPIFLPPVPPNTVPEEYLAPWQGREIWLEAALTGIRYLVSETGTVSLQLDTAEECYLPHRDERLHCHYRTELLADCCRIDLQRTREDLSSLLEAAESLGVTTAVGLYQELWDTQ